MSNRAAAVVAVGLGWVMTTSAAVDAVPGYGQVAAVFQQHCVICHSGTGAPLGLRLDSYANIQRGSDRGPVVVAGDAQGSELVRRIRGQSQPRMPLTGPPYLGTAAEAMIVAWIAAGAPRGEVEIDDAIKPAAPSTAKAPGTVLNADTLTSDILPPVTLPSDTQPSDTQPSDTLTFDQVEPILLKRCVKCHRDDGLQGKPPEGLRLGNWQQVIDGGERVVVLPGYPDASELVRKIEGRSQPRMPFDGPPFLSSEEIRTIRRWVAQGARDSQGERAVMAAGRRLRLEGRLTARWQLDDLPLQVTGGTRIKKNPQPGDYVRVRGVVRQDGAIRVERIRRR